MTIKEFSEKYEIPYYIAYNATVGLKPVASILRDKDFIEAELFRNVDRMLNDRADRKADELSRIEHMLAVMRRKGGTEVCS